MTWISALISLMFWICYLTASLECFYAFLNRHSLDVTELGLAWVSAAIAICSLFAIVTTSVVPI